MAIQFQCDNCGKSLRTDESKAGKRVKCPGCENVIRIPSSEDEMDFGGEISAEQDEAENPYRSPRASEINRPRRRRSANNYEFAGPGRRFIGAMLDGFIAVFACAPGFILLAASGAFDDNKQEVNPTLALPGFGLFGLGIITLLGIQIYLLATRSQSLAKYLLRMQILDYETRQPATFVKCAIIRSFVNGIIGALPCVGGIYSLADALFIFSAEHRCLHDHLASTCVVNLPEASD